MAFQQFAAKMIAEAAQDAAGDVVVAGDVVAFDAVLAAPGIGREGQRIEGAADRELGQL